MTYRRERGFSAVWLAAVMLFLMGAAALAVDLSGAFQHARSQQRAADLSCLAGVWELPPTADTPREAALDTAALYLIPNEPGLTGLDVTAFVDDGNVRTWTEGEYIVEIETPYAGEPTRMRVTILRESPTSFGRVIGSETLTVVQEAFCEVGSALGGGADMPFGVLSGFSGGLINFSRNNCTLNEGTNDACSGLAIPRHNDPAGSQFNVTTADNYIANMISGINWNLEVPNPAIDVLCRTVGTPGPGDNEPCNRVATVSGNDPSKVYTGLISGYNRYSPESQIGYLQKHNPIYAHGGNYYDGDTLDDVAECAGPCPTPWDTLDWETTEDVHPGVTLTSISECDCPRFIRVPIVASFPQADCTVTDPNDPEQINRCTAKVIGFEWMFMLRPYFNGQAPPNKLGESYTDFTSQGQGHMVETIAAVKIFFDDDIVVEGNCFSEYKTGAPKAVRLIAG